MFSLLLLLVILYRFINVPPWRLSAFWTILKNVACNRGAASNPISFRPIVKWLECVWAVGFRWASFWINAPHTHYPPYLLPHRLSLSESVFFPLKLYMRSTGVANTALLMVAACTQQFVRAVLWSGGASAPVVVQLYSYVSSMIRHTLSRTACTYTTLSSKMIPCQYQHEHHDALMVQSAQIACSPSS